MRYFIENWKKTGKDITDMEEYKCKVTDVSNGNVYFSSVNGESLMVSLKFFIEHAVNLPGKVKTGVEFTWKTGYYVHNNGRKIKVSIIDV